MAKHQFQHSLQAKLVFRHTMGDNRQPRCSNFFSPFCNVPFPAATYPIAQIIFFTVRTADEQSFITLLDEHQGLLHRVCQGAGHLGGCQ